LTPSLSPWSGGSPTAFHEACHAVVLRQFDIHVCLATIVEAGRFTGRTIAPLPADFDPKSNPQDERELRNRVVGYLAGDEIERELTPEGVEPTQEDYSCAAELVMDLMVGRGPGQWERATKYIDPLRPAAAMLVTSPEIRRKIDKVGAVLSEAKVLSGDEIDDLIRASDRQTT